MEHCDRGVSLHLVQMFRPLFYRHVPSYPGNHLVQMFRPLFYRHVPSYPGNRQLKQGRISVIGSSAIFIAQIAALCWDPSNKYLVVLSQFFKRQYCFALYFGVVKRHYCSLAVAIYDIIFVFRFSKYKVGCCSFHHSQEL